MLKGTIFLPKMRGEFVKKNYRTSKSTLGEIELSEKATLKVYKCYAEDGHAYIDLRIFAKTREYRGDTKSSIKIPLNKLKTLAKELYGSLDKLKV